MQKSIQKSMQNCMQKQMQKCMQKSIQKSMQKCMQKSGYVTLALSAFGVRATGAKLFGRQRLLRNFIKYTSKLFHLYKQKSCHFEVWCRAHIYNDNFQPFIKYLRLMAKKICTITAWAENYTKPEREKNTAL